MRRILQKSICFLRGNLVFTISAVAAILSMFFFPPCEAYGEYIDTSVLMMLFCLMAVVAGFREIGVFHRLSNFFLKKAGNLRQLSFLLVNLCFFVAMLVTNDVALITFVPLTVGIFEKLNNRKVLLYTVILETVAANLGSMVTPMGNPQNLYLYAHYHLTIGTFFQTLLPLAIISYLILFVMMQRIPHTSVEIPHKSENAPIPRKSMSLLLILTVLCLLTVLRIVPHWVCLVGTILGIGIVNYRLFARVDWVLLLTFVCFFIFSGNLGNIPVIQQGIGQIMEGKECLVSALCSQVISNVPAAVLLSTFTDNARGLLLGTDLGGLGTPVASLASLISYKYYCTSKIADKGKYMKQFLAINFAILIVLLVLAQIYLNILK